MQSRELVEVVRALKQDHIRHQRNLKITYTNYYFALMENEKELRNIYADTRENLLNAILFS